MLATYAQILDQRWRTKQTSSNHIKIPIVIEISSRQTSPHRWVSKVGATWYACRQSLAIPFDTYHRNDQPDPVRVATGGHLPAVVAETTTELIVLLDPEALVACDGSLDAMLNALQSAANERGLEY